MKKTNVSPLVKVEAWATPANGVSLDELLKKFKDQGIKVTRVDKMNNKIRVIHQTGNLKGAI